MKRLPDSELELMQIIWDAGHPVTRLEIEYQLPVDRKLSATTILSFLSRLQDKGFVDVYREGKSNVYEAAGAQKGLSTGGKPQYLEAAVSEFCEEFYDGRWAAGMSFLMRVWTSCRFPWIGREGERGK